MVIDSKFFETTSSVSKLTNENNIFSIGSPGYWRIPNYLPDGVTDRLKEILELRSQNDIDLHVKEVEKRLTPTEMDNSG